MLLAGTAFMGLYFMGWKTRFDPDVSISHEGGKFPLKSGILLQSLILSRLLGNILYLEEGSSRLFFGK